jgi:hypothetical protein
MKVGDIRITKKDIRNMYPDSMVRIVKLYTAELDMVEYQYIEGVSPRGVKYSQRRIIVEKESTPLSKLHKYLLSEEENHAS